MAHESGRTHLPFFANPMVRQESGTDFGHHRGISEPLTPNLADIDLTDEKATVHDANPTFLKHREATSNELFYDLFFVANLTVFSTVKEINDRKTLTQYAGFFTILWFTWYQVSMYDIRFSLDSLFDRLCKVIQFGVMIGFAVSGPTFSAGDEVEKITGASADIKLTQIIDPELSTFKALTIIMMVSRAVLSVQYFVAALMSRKRRPQAIKPLAFICVTEFVAAIIYGSLWFAFQRMQAGAYHAWYVLAFLETAISTGVSSIWRTVGFKGTHLVQRMSLLTLIILGEGIILLAKVCQTIVKGQIFLFSTSTVFNIACCVLIIYFIYMLYFDWIQERHMGTIRQQLWSFIHFPLHLTLVLSLHGASQFTAWRAATVRVNILVNEYKTLDLSQAALAKTADKIQATVDEIISGALSSSKSLETTINFIKANMTSYKSLAYLRSGNATTEEAGHVADLIYRTMINTMYTSIGFSIAEEGHAATTNAAEAATTQTTLTAEEVSAQSMGVYELVTLVFVLFYVCVGAFVMLSGLIAWIAKRDKDFGDRVRLCINFLIGITLCCVSIAAVQVNSDKDGSYMRFVYSPWVLPTAMALLFIVVVLDNIKLPSTRAEFSMRRLFQRRTRHSSKADSE